MSCSFKHMEINRPVLVLFNTLVLYIQVYVATVECNYNCIQQKMYGKNIKYYLNVEHNNHFVNIKKH